MCTLTGMRCGGGSGARTRWGEGREGGGPRHGRVVGSMKGWAEGQAEGGQGTDGGMCDLKLETFV
eukprot:352958-Chlamydomonas_euryale.AAC.2